MVEGKVVKFHVQPLEVNASMEHNSASELSACLCAIVG